MDAPAPLRLPTPAITVKDVAAWAAQMVEAGYGEVPVCVGYEAQPGHMATESVVDVRYTDEPSKGVPGKVTFAAAIRG